MSILLISYRNRLVHLKRHQYYITLYKVKSSFILLILVTGSSHFKTSRWLQRMLQSFSVIAVLRCLRALCSSRASSSLMYCSCMDCRVIFLCLISAVFARLFVFVRMFVFVRLFVSVRLFVFTELESDSVSLIIGESVEALWVDFVIGEDFPHVSSFYKQEASSVRILHKGSL